MTATCRYEGHVLHVCSDRDGRTPPRDVCHAEARAQLADLGVVDAYERDLIAEQETIWKQQDRWEQQCADEGVEV